MKLFENLIVINMVLRMIVTDGSMFIKGIRIKLYFDTVMKN